MLRGQNSERLTTYPIPFFLLGQGVIGISVYSALPTGLHPGRMGQGRGVSLGATGGRTGPSLSTVLQQGNPAGRGRACS